MNVKQQIIFIWLTVSLLWTRAVRADDADQGQSPLDAPGLQFEARIRSIRPSSDSPFKVIREVFSRESYSQVRQRSRLTLLAFDYEDLSKESQEFDYHFHSNSANRLVKVVKGSLSNGCQPEDSATLAGDLFGYSSSVRDYFGGRSWLEHKDGLPDYLIGVGRFLFISELNRNNLVLIPDDRQVIRNYKTLRYKLPFNFGSTKSPLELNFYYGKTSAHWNKLDLPMRVRLVLPKGFEFVIDYYSIEPIEERFYLSQGDSESVFSLPVGVGCGRRLQPTMSKQLEMPRVVSFRAQVHRIWFADDVEMLNDYFVAYDGYMNVLRRDSMKQQDGEPLSQTDYSVTIYDLNKRRMFNIHQHKTLKLSVVEDAMLAGRQVSASEQPISCIASSIQDQLGGSPYEPVVPFDKLVEIGARMIRGMETVSFELVSDRLPANLFPPDTFGQRLSSVTNDSSAFTLVYHFSALESGKAKDGAAAIGESRIGPLLRIDVLQRNKMLYKVEIFDFRWHLSDAPNGDRQDELFSLGDQCTNGGPQLSVNDQSLVNFDISYLSGEKGKPTEEIMSMIKNGHVRNKALARALTGGSHLSALQIHDLESQLRISEEGQIFIGFNFRLSNREFELQEAVKVGTGMPFVSVDAVDASSYEDCFWKAAKLRRLGPLLFTYCSQRCLLDTRPKLKSDTDSTIVDSNVFTISSKDNKPCTILRIDFVADPKFKPSIEVWKTFYTDFKSKTLSLPMVQMTGSGRVVELSFKIDRLDLLADKWSASQHEPHANSQRDHSILNGLGLSKSNGRVVEPKILPDATSTDASPAINSGMSLELCHSSCMANLTCKSFSVCTDGRSVECLVSEIEFRDAEFLTQIEAQVSELKSQGKRRGSILVERPKAVESGEAGDASSAQSRVSVELRVERRCRIYNKFAMEMFKSPTLVTRNLKISALRPVDSEEQCAEMCLKKSVQWLKRDPWTRPVSLASGATQMGDPTDVASEEQKQSMGSWCATFGYLNLATTTLADELKGSLGPSKLSKNGLCMLARPKWAKRSIKTNGNATQGRETTELKVSLQVFEFIYTMLFERVYGVSLQSSLDIVQDPLTEQLPPEERRELGWLENSQVSASTSSVEACAKLCFSQTIGLKPWCRSFDYLESKFIKKLADGSLVNHTRLSCTFNSLTLAEATKSVHRSALVSTKGADDDSTIWHYEPREAYIDSSAALDSIRLDKMDARPTFEFFQYELKTFGLILVLVLAFTSGLILGVILARRLMDSDQNREQSSAIEPPTRSLLSSLFGNKSSRERFHSVDLEIPELPL